MNTTTREVAVDVLKADSVEDLEPETIDRAVVLQMLDLIVTVPIAAEVVVVATTEDLVEVAMEVSTIMMVMEEIITPRQLTGGLHCSRRSQSRDPFSSEFRATFPASGAKVARGL